MTKRELEEINEQLQELVRELESEKRQLTLSLKLACAQIEQLTTQLQQQKERSGKLMRYVRSLREWASSRSAGSYQTTSQSGSQSGSARWIPA